MICRFLQVAGIHICSHDTYLAGNFANGIGYARDW